MALYYLNDWEQDLVERLRKAKRLERQKRHTLADEYLDMARAMLESRIKIDPSDDGDTPKES